MERVNAIIQHERYRTALQSIAHFEVDRCFCRHDMEHFLSVARLMHLLSLAHPSAPEVELLYATALLHDIGRAAQYACGAAHAEAGAALATEILPDCGYQEGECSRILQAILAHKSKTLTDDPLSNLLQEADQRSRNCFCCAAQADCYWPESRRNKGVTL